MEEMNCIWLNKQNPYDILCRIQESLNHGCKCVLSAMTSHDISCPEDKDCKKCIQHWMTEKEKKRR